MSREFSRWHALLLFLVALLMSSESLAQTQYPVYQYGPYDQQQYQYQYRQRPRPLRYSHAISVRLTGGAGFILEDDEDVAMPRFSIIGGPHFVFTATERNDASFYLIPEAGYTLSYRMEYDESGHHETWFSHLAELGARIGFSVTPNSYLLEIFSLDLFARIVVGADAGRGAIGIHAGIDIAIIAHLLQIQAGYQWLNHFDTDNDHAIVVMGVLDVPHCVLTFVRPPSPPPPR